MGCADFQTGSSKLPSRVIVAINGAAYTVSGILLCAAAFWPLTKREQINSRVRVLTNS
jgi:hypothetical protein